MNILGQRSSPVESEMNHSRCGSMHGGMSLSQLRSNKIGCVCDSLSSASRIGCHARRVHTASTAYQRRLICSFSMACDQTVCAVRSPTLDRIGWSDGAQFPTRHVLLVFNAGRVGCCRYRSARAVSSSGCASFSWVLMGKPLC